MPSSMTASGVQVSESAKAAPQKGTFDPKTELTVVETLVANDVHLRITTSNKWTSDFSLNHHSRSRVLTLLHTPPRSSR